jgi:hypothetical protein
MPQWSLTKEERSIAEGMRFFGYCWEDVVRWLHCGTDERKVHEIYSLYIRDGARLQ